MMVVKGIFNGWLSLKRVLEMIHIRKQLQTISESFLDYFVF